MTGAQIITKFESLVGDSLDADLELQILNDAKDAIENERPWEMLKKTQTAAATTSAIPLPIDYRETLALYVGTIPYYQIPFEQKTLFQNSGLHWYLDMANSNLYLLGSNLTGTVTHVYRRQTDDIATGTSPVWPARFHSIIPLKMAEIFFAIDQGERVLTWDKEMAIQAEMIRRRMVDWDARLQRMAIENKAYRNEGIEVDLGTM